MLQFGFFAIVSYSVIKEGYLMHGNRERDSEKRVGDSFCSTLDVNNKYMYVNKNKYM